jgi:hypothetical protein
MNPDVVFIVIAFALPLTFAAIFMLVPYWTGWAALARRYRYQGTIPGPRWGFQDLCFGPVATYSGCISAGADNEGLYLAFPPRIGHPPLRIPWEELTFDWKEQNFLGWRDYWVEFTPAQTPGIHFRLRPKLVQKMRDAMNLPLPIPTRSASEEESASKG